MSKRHHKPLRESTLLAPTFDDRTERLRLYKETYDELVKKQISNSENFDRSILTLSSSALGLSLAFIKDVVQFAGAELKEVLILSWFSPGMAIIFTISSYMTSQKAITFQIKLAQSYYLDRQNEALQKRNPFASMTVRLNSLAGISFILATTLTIIFVAVNLMQL